MMTTAPRVLLTLIALGAAPLHAALLRRPAVARKPSLQMCASQQRVSPGLNVEDVACDVRKQLHLELVKSFLAATERGDAKSAMAACTDDFLYKTHRATTESLAAAEERLHTKVPAPNKVTKELDEESEGIFVREIVVKPVPFVTVTVRQEFEVRNLEGGAVRLCRAEYIKL